MGWFERFIHCRTVPGSRGGGIPREDRGLSWVGVRGDTLLLSAVTEGAEGEIFPPPDQYPPTFTPSQLEGVSLSLKDKIKENQSLSEYLKCLQSDGTR